MKPGTSSRRAPRLIAARGTNSIYHYNGIKVWHVRADGTVTNVEA